MHTVTQYPQLVEQARKLAEPAHGLTTAVRDALAGRGDILTTEPTTEPLPAVFVDGAVAADQSDAMTWIAAVAVAQPTEGPFRVLTTEAVAPVCSDTERLRSALMASCELQAAVTDLSATTFVDGGLVTALLSVAYESSFSDPEVTRVCRDRFREIDLVEVVDTYIRQVTAGRVVALPKQDTGQGYVTGWADNLHLAEDARTALRRLRDRPLAHAVLEPGEMLRPRPATEARSITAKGDGLSAVLNRKFAEIRTCEDLHVAYVRPQQGMRRAIKFEYAESDPVDFTVGRRLAGLLDRMCVGPRILEPAGQHLVDRECKRQVQMHMVSVEAALTAGLAGSPAVQRYRT